MFMKRSPRGLHFGFGFGEGRLNLLAGKLHLALDLFASALQSRASISLPACSEIFGAAVPTPGESADQRVLEWITCTNHLITVLVI